jgi:hypothetical protein
MTAAESRHMERVASLGCCVCRRLGMGYVPAEVHHVAEGSGLRSNYAVAPLCSEHHRGASGLHGGGVKPFLARFRVPGESEYGLLVWTIEDLNRGNTA